MYGALQDGIFEGNIRTTNDNLYVERASKYFDRTVPFHSILYSAEDVELPRPSDGNALPQRWCGLHGRTEEWMNTVLQAIRSTNEEQEGVRNRRFLQVADEVSKTMELIFPSRTSWPRKRQQVGEFSTQVLCMGS